MIISLASIKGGVAKSTTCVNLAYALSKNTPKPYKVLIIDFDSQGGSTHHLSSRFMQGYKSSLFDFLSGKYELDYAVHTYCKNLDIIPVSFSFYEIASSDFSKGMKGLVEEIKKRYDFIFFDLAPSIYPGSIIPLSFSDSCIIPVYAKGGLSLLGLKNQGKIVAKIKKEENPSLDVLGILATFVDRTKISKEVVSYLTEKWEEDTFKTIIRENTHLSQASSLGKTIFEHAPRSNGAKDYSMLAKEFVKRVKEQKKSIAKPKRTKKKGAK